LALERHATLAIVPSFANNGAMPRPFQFRLSSLFLTTLAVGVVIALSQQFGRGVLPYVAAALLGWAGTKYDASRGRGTLVRGAYTGTLAAALGFILVAAAVRYSQPIGEGRSYSDYLLSRKETGEAAVSGAGAGLLLTALITAKRMP
jgi:hypothetical protein